MYFLEMIKNKEIDDAHVQMYKYKKSWRIYASYDACDDEQSCIEQKVSFRSFSNEDEALSFYGRLDTKKAIVTFVNKEKLD